MRWDTSGVDPEPYLTTDLPGVGGVLREKPEDFRVDELPKYAACGEGEHVYFRVKKRGLATFEAVRRIARDLKVPERHIGYAGLKDARAVTTQWMSALGTTPEAVAALGFRNMEVDSPKRHGNRLKIGHLLGNRFRLRVRQVDRSAADRAGAILDVLIRRGVPNYFGQQRFGIRQDGHIIGEALLRRDYDGFVRTLLGGRTDLESDERLRASREHFDAGRIQQAYDAMPLSRRTEKKALHALLRFDGDTERACFAVPKRMRQMYASAFQSALFNKIVAARLQDLDSIEAGDLAFLHHNRAAFRVEAEHLERERRRVAAFEISVSGPIFGTRVDLAEGPAAELEARTLAESGLDTDSFRASGGLRLKGLRRPLRTPLRNVEIFQEDPEVLRVDFDLPSGCFATSVMREVMKTETVSKRS